MARLLPLMVAASGCGDDDGALNYTVPQGQDDMLEGKEHEVQDGYIEVRIEDASPDSPILNPAPDPIITEAASTEMVPDEPVMGAKPWGTTGTRKLSEEVDREKTVAETAVVGDTDSGAVAVKEDLYATVDSEVPAATEPGHGAKESVEEQADGDVAGEVQLDTEVTAQRQEEAQAPVDAGFTEAPVVDSMDTEELLGSEPIPAELRVAAQLLEEAELREEMENQEERRQDKEDIERREEELRQVAALLEELDMTMPEELLAAERILSGLETRQEARPPPLDEEPAKPPPLTGAAAREARKERLSRRLDQGLPKDVKEEEEEEGVGASPAKKQKTSTLPMKSKAGSVLHKATPVPPPNAAKAAATSQLGTTRTTLDDPAVVGRARREVRKAAQAAALAAGVVEKSDIEVKEEPDDSSTKPTVHTVEDDVVNLWSPLQTFWLGAGIDEAWLEGKASMLEDRSLVSVKASVEALNSGRCNGSSDFYVVYSKSSEGYHLLYKAGKEEEARNIALAADVRQKESKMNGKDISMVRAMAAAHPKRSPHLPLTDQQSLYHQSLVWRVHLQRLQLQQSIAELAQLQHSLGGELPAVPPPPQHMQFQMQQQMAGAMSGLVAAAFPGIAATLPGSGAQLKGAGAPTLTSSGVLTSAGPPVKANVMPHDGNGARPSGNTAWCKRPAHPLIQGATGPQSPSLPQSAFPNQAGPMPGGMWPPMPLLPLPPSMQAVQQFSGVCGPPTSAMAQVVQQAVNQMATHKCYAPLPKPMPQPLPQPNSQSVGPEPHSSVQRTPKRTNEAIAESLAEAFSDIGGSAASLDASISSETNGSTPWKRRERTRAELPAAPVPAQTQPVAPARSSQLAPHPPPPPPPSQSAVPQLRHGFLPEGTSCSRCRRTVVACGGVFCGRVTATGAIAGCGAPTCWRCMNRLPREDMGTIRTTKAEFRSLGEGAWWMHEFCMTAQDKRDYFASGGGQTGGPDCGVGDDSGDEATGRFAWE